MDAYSEQHGERFHQDILDFECCYLGEHNEGMKGDYIQRLIRESDLESIVRNLDKPCISNRFIFNLLLYLSVQ